MKRTTDSGWAMASDQVCPPVASADTIRLDTPKTYASVAVRHAPKRASKGELAYRKKVRDNTTTAAGALPDAAHKDLVQSSKSSSGAGDPRIRREQIEKLRLDNGTGDSIRIENHVCVHKHDRLVVIIMMIITIQHENLCQGFGSWFSLIFCEGRI